jgi:sugar/nucleoside kinase (ribokinase family)
MTAKRPITILTHILALFSTILLGSLEAEEENKYQILSLSAAIIDHLVFVEEDQLPSLANEKGGWAPIDYETLCMYLDIIKEKSYTSPGGSGVNVLKGLSQLGHKCAVVGKVGSDEMGDHFIRELEKKGIASFLERGALPTGQAICFITPDGQRTFRSYLGASHSLTDLELKPSLFENITLFHIEGYQLVDPDLVTRALKLAKKSNIKISIDLASAEIVKRYKGYIYDILGQYVDIVLCNQDEAQELTGLPPKEACSALSSLCSVSVVTMGEKGCWTQSGETQLFTPAFVVDPIDTTGAGDYFASGFLNGVLKGLSLQSSALQGALVASYVVLEVGTEICENSWEEIKIRLGNGCHTECRTNPIGPYTQVTSKFGILALRKPRD